MKATTAELTSFSWAPLQPGTELGAHAHPHTGATCQPKEGAPVVPHLQVRNGGSGRWRQMLGDLGLLNLCFSESRLSITAWLCCYPSGSCLAVNTQHCTWPREESPWGTEFINSYLAHAKLAAVPEPTPSLLPSPQWRVVLPRVLADTRCWGASPMAPPCPCSCRLEPTHQQLILEYWEESCHLDYILPEEVTT